MPEQDAYVTDLSAALEHAESWWAALVRKHGRERLALRWPAGPAAHPRVLAVYRAHHLRLLEGKPSERPGPAPRFDDPAAWGSEAEGDPTELLPPKPIHVLIDRLHEQAPKLHARMVYLVVAPIGELPDPRPRMTSLVPVPERTHELRAFDLGHRHDVTRGLERLLGAGIDLRPYPMRPMTLDDADDAHRLAFACYRRDLERALAVAEHWWTSELARLEARGLSAEQASSELYAKHPAGIAGHPRVIGVVQSYWALCHEINHALPDSNRHVAPELMLLAWLRDGRHGSWIEALTALPYWPIALDADGSWS